MSTNLNLEEQLKAAWKEIDRLERYNEKLKKQIENMKERDKANDIRRTTA